MIPSVTPRAVSPQIESLLGYTPDEVRDVLGRLTDDADAEVETMLRDALRLLAGAR